MAVKVKEKIGSSMLGDPDVPQYEPPPGDIPQPDAPDIEDIVTETPEELEDKLYLTTEEVFNSDPMAKQAANFAIARGVSPSAGWLWELGGVGGAVSEIKLESGWTWNIGSYDTTDDDYFLSPEGVRWTYEDLLSQPTYDESMSEDISSITGEPTTDEQAEVDIYQGMKSLFPDMTPEQSIEYYFQSEDDVAEERIIEFLTRVREAGYSDTTVNLLKSLYSEITDEDLSSIFGYQISDETKTEDWWHSVLFNLTATWKNIESGLLTSLKGASTYTPNAPYSQGIAGDLLARRNGEVKEAEPEVFAEGVYNWANEQIETNKKELETWMKEHPQYATTYYDEADPMKDPSLLVDAGYWGHLFATNIPTISGVLVSGIILATTRNPALAAAATGALFEPLNVQSAYDDLIASGATDMEATQIANTVGTAISALDVAGVGVAGKAISPAFMKIFKKNAIEGLTESVKKNLTKKGLVLGAVKTFAGTDLAEVVTEDLQQVIQNAVVKTFDENRDLFEGLDEVTVQTALMMLPFGFMGGGAYYQQMKSYLPENVVQQIDQTASELTQVGIEKERAEAIAVTRVMETEEGNQAVQTAIEQTQTAIDNGEIERVETKQDIIKNVKDISRIKWYRGTTKDAIDGQDLFFSSDESVAGDYGTAKVGDTANIREITKEELPEKVYTTSNKESIAEELGIKIDPYINGSEFDSKVKAKLQAKGYDSVHYLSGTLEAEELHIFGKPTAEQRETETAKEARTENFTQFAVRNGYPSDYDIVDHTTLSPSGKVSQRARKWAQESQAERLNQNRIAHNEYEKAILNGEVIDPTGKLTKEGLESDSRKAAEKEKASNIDIIKGKIKFIESLGTVSHKQNGELKINYQRQVDDLNAELEKLTKSQPTAEQRDARIEQINNILKTKGATPQGEFTKAELKLELARLEAEKQIKAEPNYIEQYKQDIEQETQARMAPYHGATKAVDWLKPYDSKQLNEMWKVYDKAVKEQKPAMVGWGPGSPSTEFFKPQTGESLKALKMALVEYVKANLPPKLRGKMLEAVAKIETGVEFDEAVTKVNKILEAYNDKNYRAFLEKNGLSIDDMNPMSPLPVESIKKLINLIQTALPARAMTEQMKHEVRQQQNAVLKNIFQSNVGYDAFTKAYASLKGKMPTAEYVLDMAGANYTEQDTINLVNAIRTSDKIYTFQKITAYKALQDLLSGEIPTTGELLLLEKVFGKELAQAVLKKMSAGKRVFNEIVSALNLPRALLACFDNSFILRQGAMLAWGNPKEAFEAVKQSFKVMFSEENYNALMESIAQNPNFELANESKLYIAERGKYANITEREEAFMSNLIDKIPVLRDIIKISERAFVGGLNKLRADVFYKFCEYNRQRKPTMGEYQAAANMINILSGRGNMSVFGKNFNQWAPMLNAGFFAPRYMISRFQAPAQLFNKYPAVRKMAAKNLISWFSANLVFLGLIVLAGGTVELDPRSSDFGKGRIGNTRFDFWAGEVQIARFLAQFITEQRTSVTSGVTGEANRFDTAMSFLRSKFSPLAGFVVDFMKGETMIGEEFTPENAPTMAYERLVPLFLQDLIDAVKESGMVGVAEAIPAFFGVGLQTFGSDTFDGMFTLLGTVEGQKNGEDDMYTSKDLYSDIMTKLQGNKKDDKGNYVLETNDVMDNQYFPEWVKSAVKARDVLAMYEDTELRNEYLMNNPEDNALLALWGRSDLYSFEAYEKLESLTGELGINIKDIELDLPAKEAYKKYFEYTDKMLQKYDKDMASARASLDMSFESITEDNLNMFYLKLEYALIRDEDGDADSTARKAFRKSHPEFDKYGIEQGWWKALDSTSSSYPAGLIGLFS